MPKKPELRENDEVGFGSLGSLGSQQERGRDEFDALAR
jgi:hypothetical protein